MNYEKTLEFLRQVLIVLVIFYLTKKIFALEDRVTYLEKKNSEEIVNDEEYSTENNIKVFNDVLKKQVSSVATINIPQFLPQTVFVTQHQNSPKKEIIVVSEETQETSKSSESHGAQACPINKPESDSPKINLQDVKPSLKEIQEIAISKNIDIKVSGKNKSRKKLIDEINI